MPASNTRIIITPTSEAHSILLSNWAILEGRTLSNLCSSLLENAINEAISKGTVNPQALEMMNEFINVRRNQLKFEYGKTLSLEQAKADELLNEISSKVSGDKENESKFEEWTTRAEEVWEQNTNNERKEKSFYRYTPDLKMVAECVRDLKLYDSDASAASKILTKASMAGCVLSEIYNTVINMGNLESGARLDALENICNAMIDSQRLSLTERDSEYIPF